MTQTEQDFLDYLNPPPTRNNYSDSYKRAMAERALSHFPLSDRQLKKPRKLKQQNKYAA
jgi:hypothetical protein